MVPFIDVMLVLLIIFMVSAPLITTGLVDLPASARAASGPRHVVEVLVGADAAAGACASTAKPGRGDAEAP